MFARLNSLAAIFRRPAGASAADESTIGSPYRPVATPAASSAEGLATIADLRKRISSLQSAKLRLPTWDRPLVTMSIDGPALRIATVRRGSIETWISVPLTQAGVSGGQITDPIAVGAQIDEICDRYAVPRSRVAWAIPGYQVSTYFADLPDQRGENLRRAIAEEAERFLGFGSNECFLYYQRLEGRIRRRSVFILAVPKTTVLNALEALDAAGIRPWTMDIRPLAIARATGRPSAIVVNLEEGSLDLVIVEHGVPRFLRSLQLPASLGVEGAQDRLLEETERGLNYYDDSAPDHPLDPDVPLYLTGSLATGISLAERLRAISHHPIGRLATSLSHPANFPVGDYAVNLGLALKKG